MSLNSTQHISIYSAIDAAVSLLQLPSANEVLEDFARWAYEAESKIGSTDTFKRFECELEVENYRACLPSNFMYLNALKIGENWIDVTNRDFRMFHKAKSTPVVTTPEKYLNGNKIVCNPGQIGSKAVLFQGTFLTNDVVVVTITNTDCGNVVTNTFQHLVAGGETTQDIITDLAAQINAILLPYTAVADLANLRLIITGRDVTVNFNIVLHTDSVTGTLSQIVLQKHVAPSEECLPCEDGSVQESGSSNLANKGAVNLNNQFQGKNLNDGFFPYNSFGVNNSVHSIVNGYVHFNAIENGKVGISYMGIMMDDDGWPMIKSTHVKAVSTYIVYMYILRGYYAGERPEYMKNSADRDWHWECGQARGDDEMPNSQEYMYLANQYMQLLPLPNKNFF